jgi:putative FmdB family regulatory protein
LPSLNFVIQKDDSLEEACAQSGGRFIGKMPSVPIFEYACRSCRHEFETLVRGGETPSCVRCASTALDKKLSVFATRYLRPSRRPGVLLTQ